MLKKLMFCLLTVMVITAKSQTCGDLVNYIPANNVTIPVNFIFFQPLSGPGEFDTVTQATCQDIINFMNSKWSGLSAPSKPLPAPYTAPTGYTDTKIRFVFKAIIFKRDAQYDSTHVGLVHFPSYAVTDSTALNIVHNIHNGGPQGNTDIGTNLVRLIEGPHNPTNIFHSDTRHLYYCHEVGHALGLRHPFNTDTIGRLLPMSQFSNPNGTTLIPNIVNDIWYEDSATVVSGVPNNFMGYSWSHREYLSPKQIGYMHYMLKTNSVVRKIVSQSACTIGADWPMSSGTYAGPIYADADLVIPQGNHVIIRGCIFMKPGARIIIEPGGKLSLSNVTIGNFCGSPWKGIEVQSNPGGIQTIDPLTLMPHSSVGMLEIDSSSISDAEIAINVGRFNTYGSYNVGPNVNFPGSYIPNTAAGIVRCQNTHFVDNRITANFNPYYVLAPNPGNISYFKNCVFDLTTAYNNVDSPFAAININNTYAIKILNSRFNQITNISAIGVRCVNGSVYIGTDPNLSGQSFFKGFTYGVYISNWLTNIPVAPSRVQSVKFDQLNVTPTNCLGGIYAMGTFGTQITDCEFDISHPTSSMGSLTYGLYLDGCDGYVVENNTFNGNTNLYLSGGIFVNNSGPGANSIYNNAFQNLQQGIWAQNINYSPGVNGTGLKMNCDDFTNVRFNMGVQSFYSGFNCANCPPIAQPAGVAETQGVIYLSEKDNVRNTYNTGICINKNKYYIDTDNGFVLTSHGSFHGGNYHPTPQPNCSDSAKLIDLVGPPTSNPRSFWCQANVFAGLSKAALNDNKSDNRSIISSLTSELHNKLDGGQTQDLLNLFSDGTTVNDIYTALISKDFLSDSVLRAFLGMSGLTNSFIDSVFTKNAPVHPSIWQQVTNLGLDPDFFAHLSDLQFNQNKLSARETIQSELNLAHTELGLLTNESVRRFLSDTTGIAFDSISAIYALNEVPNSAFKRVDAAIATYHFTEAASLISALNTDSANTNICTVFGYISALHENPDYAETMRADDDIRLFLESKLGSNKPLLDTYCKALLDGVYFERQNEITLQPADYVPEVGERQGNFQTGGPGVLVESLNDKVIRIFPNPASDRLTVQNEDALESIHLEIVDLTGKVFIKQDCDKNCVIDLKTLQNSVYLLNLYQQGKFLSTKKLVIIK